MIYEAFFHTTWFKQGFILEDCVIIKKFNYENGGHNEKPIIIKRNISCEFAVFSDCQFDALVVIEGNLFSGGTNILNDFHTQPGNSFAKVSKINNNLGQLDDGL